jgi:2-polyprenyl-3-methyl-5-hydroxy-6-metoxy-1,4-benzoquinol methylase
MVDLSNRSSEEEIMDDLSASGPVINQTLVELETINTLLGGNYVTLNGLDKVIQGKSLKNTLRIADLGCGGGDILRLVSNWLEKKEINAELIGFDANPNIIAFAQKYTAQKNISYQAVNIFSDDFKTQQFDVVIATLFFHHFDSDQLAEFLSQLRRQTSIGIVINDLHRHWFAYYSIKWLTALFSKSPMVKNDAALSVARSFRKKDWITILEKAGIKQYRMRWMWAFRWQVIID